MDFNEKGNTGTDTNTKTNSSFMPTTEFHVFIDCNCAAHVGEAPPDYRKKSIVGEDGRCKTEDLKSQR